MYCEQCGLVFVKRCWFKYRTDHISKLPLRRDTTTAPLRSVYCAPCLLLLWLFEVGRAAIADSPHVDVNIANCVIPLTIAGHRELVYGEMLFSRFGGIP